ncbi:MAG: TM2 domain-containing protein [Phycisphaerales bacterium]|nr:TM2 domain-containing protein [Phycisphaerales bacterium]
MSNFPNSAPSPFGVPPVVESKRVLAGVLGILLGALGIHKFILGYTTAGIIMLLVTVLTCGIAGTAMSIIGLIEGIIYLTKTDAEFIQMYQQGKKEWF